MWVSLDSEENNRTQQSKDGENMQKTPAQSSGNSKIPASGIGSNGKNTEEPLMVTQEAVEAYERRTGFFGIGRIMVEDGHWIIVTQEELARSRAQIQANRHAALRQRGVA